jgi:GR25 family glycosyltransferase involved in LPS biosynthesis
MSYINSVIDKVFVINLDKDTERLSSIDKQLRESNILYERFSGILGKNIATDSRLSPFCSQFCTDGIKGCALSHRTIWETAIQNKYSTVMILEDDVVIPPNIQEKVRDILQRVPEDWEVIYLGCKLFCQDKHLSSKIGNRLIGMTAEEHDRDINKVKGSAGTYAVIFKTSFLEKIMDEPITTHIDVELQGWIKKYGGKAYGLHPEVITPGDDTSGKSNLSDTFPPMLNSLLNKGTIAEVPVGWALSENFMKVGGLNINPLLVFLMAAVAFLPPAGLFLMTLWLLSEWAIGGDTRNFVRFVTLLGTVFAARLLVMRGKI